MKRYTAFDPCRTANETLLAFFTRLKKRGRKLIVAAPLGIEPNTGNIINAVYQMTPKSRYGRMSLGRLKYFRGSAEIVDWFQIIL